MKNSKNIRIMTYTAVLTAMVTVVTAFIHIPTANNGYVHFGDSLIYFASMILPFPYGIFTGSLGGALSDYISGAQIYIIPTFIIKAFNSLVFYVVARKCSKIICIKSIIAMVLSSFVTIIGYYIASKILFGAQVAFIKEILGSIVQISLSAIVFIILGISADKMDFKGRLASKL